MLGSAHGVMRLHPILVGPDLRRRYHRALLCWMSAPQMPCLWTTSPSARSLSESFSSTIGLSTYLKSSCLKRGLLRGDTCGWRSAVSGRVLLEIDLAMWFVRLQGSTPSYHDVDVTVTSARTNTDILHKGARLPLPGSLALGAQHGKLDADLRTSTLLGTPSVQMVHDYYRFALDDGGRLAPLAV
jgi:hypothetical protein